MRGRQNKFQNLKIGKNLRLCIWSTSSYTKQEIYKQRFILMNNKIKLTHQGYAVDYSLNSYLLFPLFLGAHRSSSHSITSSASLVFHFGLAEANEAKVHGCDWWNCRIFLTSGTLGTLISFGLLSEYFHWFISLYACITDAYLNATLVLLEHKVWIGVTTSRTCRYQVR